MSLAPFAVRIELSRGRLYSERESPTRTPWQRDRDRIVHNSAFRKLQYKTQVFVNHEGDFFRTRLTHSLEVAQIGRAIARQLRLNEDLTEALALAHDLGHTPFGHAGEEALDLAMREHGGFDHNAQSLRVVTKLEERYATFDGLNLTWETLEGLVKHNGPLTTPAPYVAAYNARHPLWLETFASAEAQVAALADDIAYHSHDLDDGMRAGLFGFDDIAPLPVVGEALALARAIAPEISAPRLRHETIRRVIDVLIGDVVAESGRRIGKLDPADADAIRHAPTPVIAFSEARGTANLAIKAFLTKHMYHHWRVNRMTSKARRLIGELYALLSTDLALLPKEWQDRASPDSAAVTVADYIAGMTDRYAIDEYRRLTDPSFSG